MKPSLLKTLLLVTIFSSAMAFIENAVVIYLRELYYPEGFSVAFKIMPERIILVELFRELATLTMLFAIGWLAGKSRDTKLAWFLYAFAIWDIFYYLWLKMFINWPTSIFEWDILFLLPVTWLAPVLAPIICSISMILLSILIILSAENYLKFSLKKTAWITILTGALVIFISFTKDYSGIIIKHGLYKEFSHLTQNPQFVNIAKCYIPKSFSWVLFWMGELLVLTGIIKGLLHK